MQYEAHGVRVRWPIALNRSKPLGEKPNRQLRRVNIISQDAVDSRQAETASKGIDRRIQNAIDPQLVHEPEESLLDEPGHTRVHRQASLAPAIHQAANHRRLQVDRGEGDTKFLLRDASAKAQAGCRNHGIRGPPLSDDVIERHNVWKNRSLGDAIE